MNKDNKPVTLSEFVDEMAKKYPHVDVERRRRELQRGEDDSRDEKDQSD